MKYWGKHLLLDVANGDLESVRSKEVVQNFVNELVVAIDMIPFGPTWIERFATHDETKSGISFVQMIETSNITGHFVDKDGSFYIDVFSCKDFDGDTVLDLVEKHFGKSVVFTNVDLINRDSKTAFNEDGEWETLTIHGDDFKAMVLESLKDETIHCKGVIADIDVVVLSDQDEDEDLIVNGNVTVNGNILIYPPKEENEDNGI